MWLSETKGCGKPDGSRLSRKMWAVEAKAVTGSLWRPGRKAWERITLTSPHIGETPVGLALWCGDQSFIHLLSLFGFLIEQPPEVVLSWSFKPGVNWIHLHHCPGKYLPYLAVSHRTFIYQFIYSRKSLSQKKPRTFHIIFIAQWIIEQSLFKDT